MQNDLNIKGVKAGVDVLFSLAVIGVFSAVIDVPGTSGCYRSGCLMLCFSHGGFLSHHSLCTMQYVCVGSKTRMEKLCQEEKLQFFSKMSIRRSCTSSLSEGSCIWQNVAVLFCTEGPGTTTLSLQTSDTNTSFCRNLRRHASSSAHLVVLPPFFWWLKEKTKHDLQLLMAATGFNCWD